MKTIEERVREAFVAADSTGTPQEVLGDDGKRVMLIVCPKDRRPLPDDDAAMAAQRFLNEWGMFNFSADMCLAALLRTRDARAREAGRVEGWEQAQKASALVVHNAWGRAPTGPVTKALEQAHDAICNLKRPDRAKEKP